MFGFVFLLFSGFAIFGLVCCIRVVFCFVILCCDCFVCCCLQLCVDGFELLGLLVMLVLVFCICCAFAFCGILFGYCVFVCLLLV